MKTPLGSLAERIRDDVDEIERLTTRVVKAWERARDSGDDFYLDSVALNLHGVYSGLERIFWLIAQSVDNHVPQNHDWHQALLMQMTQEATAIRPAVISPATLQSMGEYRGFRHVVRNVYTFHLDPAKLERLVSQLGEVFYQVRTELLAFADFLDQSA